MTEAKDKDEKPKKLSLGGTLSLKGGSGAGARAPSSAPGVSVEVRRKRGPAQQTATPAAAGRPADAAADKPADKTLTSSERDARAEALRKAMEGGGAKRTAMPKRVTLDDVKKKEEAAKEEEASIAEDARAKELEEMARIDADEGAKKAEVQAAAPEIAQPPKEFEGRRNLGRDAAPVMSVREQLKKNAKAPAKRTTPSERRGGRLTVTQAINRDYERKGQSLAAQKRAQQKARMAAKGPKEDAQKIFREVIVPETITVQELSNRMTEPSKEIVKALMKLGVMATTTQAIDADTAEIIIEEFGHTVRRVTDADVEIGLDGIEDAAEDMQARPPVVTIMGHVDHGKTSLLDAMRGADVAAGEAGGITQHIGAYQVSLESGNKITFLDTPGHAAFTEMRARGADVTDIVVIVVSAEDSIMPQTIESIAHAKAAEVPVIIAVNKIDLPAANPTKVKQDLLQHEIVVEEMGGDIQCVEVSAKKSMNLDKLEDAIMLQAEILELKANPDRHAQGYVVESKLEKGRGPVATVLIQNGSLRIGHIFVAGAEFGKVRALINDRGEHVKEAIPGEPVEVLGFNGIPDAGDAFNVTPDEAKAREVAEYRAAKAKELAAAKAIKGRTTIEDLLLIREEGEKTKLRVIVKADVHGSIEAITGSFAKMEDENEGIAVQVIHSGAGGITESDVKLAQASGAWIVGFNVRANPQATALSAHESVKINYYNIIYNLIDDAKNILSGMLSPVEREEYIGQAKIQEVFNITKVGKVAGCVVEAGMVKRGSKVRLLRDDVVIHEGMLKTLKRHKDEVKEVKEGTECGMAFETYDDIKEGDVIECFEIIEEERTVS